MTELTPKDLFKAIHRSQHTQRNWDLSKEIPQEHLDIIVEAATQCPSKQNRAFYKTHVITDRNLIEQLHSTTKGFGRFPNPETGELEPLTNPQTLANVLFVFESYLPLEEHERVYSPIGRAELDEETKQRMLVNDQQQAIGVAAGYINMVATLLGYETGCCGCFVNDKSMEILGIENNILLMMGVGFRNEKLNRRFHHEDNSIKFPTFRKGIMPVIYHTS